MRKSMNLLALKKRVIEFTVYFDRYSRTILIANLDCKM